MNILYIAKNLLKRSFRDRKSLFLSMALPIIMIIILGTALKSVFEEGNLKIDSIKVAYLNEDGGNMSKEFENFLQKDEINKLLDVINISSVEEGKELIKDKKITATIVVPKEYSQEIEKGNKGNIQVYGSKYDNFHTGIIKNIIDSFNSVGNTITAIETIKKDNIKYNRFNALDEEVLYSNNSIPKAMDYYAITMLIYAILNAAISAAAAIGDDYFSDIAYRMKSSPIKRYEMFLGKLLGCTIDTLIKSLIIIGFTKVAYGVNWGHNFGMIIFIVITMSVFSKMFGMMVCILTGNISTASSLLKFINIFFTFIAGGYVAIISTDVNASKVMHLSPSLYAQLSLFNVIYDNKFSQCVQFFTTQGYILILWGLFLVMFLILMVAERRRRA